MKILALIPARAGSKGVPNKNLQEINGKSLVQICIETAQQVSEIDEIFVSSDSERILSLSADCGASLIKRSAEASGDKSRAEAVVEHFFQYVEGSFHESLLLVYLQPTSPFNTSDSIRECIRLYLENSHPVVSVKKIEEFPEKMLTLDKKGRLAPFLPGAEPTINRQELSERLIPTGAIYVFSEENFNESKNIPVSGALPCVVSGKESLDVDSELDLEIARKLGESK